MASPSRSLCRSCRSPLETIFADLGHSPISNAFPRQGTDAAGEAIYPLKALVCDRCFLVQVADVAGREAHFNEDYAYFSSMSSSWLDHARRYADMAVERFGLTSASSVMEIASNDGYLLRRFVERGIPALGVDPAANCAAAARKVGVETEVGFFGRDLAASLRAERGAADLMVANNVLAHVPDLDDFVAGFAAILSREGSITFEFPHLLDLIDGVQFDTIYHEHFSYLSLLALRPLFERHGLAAYDVERLPTHGGSLRLYVGHVGAGWGISEALAALQGAETEAGLADLRIYRRFEETVRATKRDLLSCLIDLKRRGASICGYGAPAKGTTLLNYCGIGSDFLDFTVDRNEAKQGRRIPGTGIEIGEPGLIFERRPDYVLILPWNIRDEIMAELSGIRDWGGRFIVPIPAPVILDGFPPSRPLQAIA